ncbi:hypothetical protein E2C01_093153 [Portunus trituberculatus]|uniref:Uncharacterized protein n=1 Tax=Portunus trituberculatus TaxID=210409 RepID=A0A5B7JXV9_PORTR|nr:hypothetical protein [Portunus trituberculatus]
MQNQSRHTHKNIPLSSPFSFSSSSFSYTCIEPPNPSARQLVPPYCQPCSEPTPAATRETFMTHKLEESLRE